MDILFELGDDYGAHGLTEDWTKLEWLFRQHDEKRSGGKEKVTGDYTLLPEESLARDGLEELDLEALIREAYEIVKAQIEAEEGSVELEEDTSLCTKDGAYKEAGKTYDGNMREGAERATLSYYGKGTGWRRPGTTKR